MGGFWVVLREVLKRNPLFGIPAKEKSPKTKDPELETRKAKTKNRKPNASKKAENAFLLNIAKKRR